MAPHPPPHRAKILTLPLEVATELMRQLYRNEVIELSDIGSLGRLQDVAANQTSLAVFKVGFLDDDLVARLMIQEAIVKFACRVDVHRIDVVRFPLLHHLRRLRIDIQFLAFEHPLGVLSNLPSIQEVSVAVKCVNWRESIAIDFWVESIDEVVWNNTADLVKVEELTHSEWRYELVLEATFWEGFGLGDWKVGCGTHGRFGLRCKVCVSKGRILELDAEEGVKEEWRRALEGELGLEKGMKGKNSDGDGDQDEEEDEDDDDNDDDNDGDEDEGEDEEDAEAQEEHTSQEPPEHQIAKRSQHQEACTREDDDDAQRAVDNLKEVVDEIQEDGTEARDYLIKRPASCFIQGFVNACSQRA